MQYFFDLTQFFFDLTFRKYMNTFSCRKCMLNFFHIKKKKFGFYFLIRLNHLKDILNKIVDKHKNYLVRISVPH